MFAVSWIFIFLVAGVVSALLTGVLRRYALAKQLIDIPNIRSSHSVPTPRGGGVAIVVVFLLGLLSLSNILEISSGTLWALCGAGAWIALIGFLDDHGHIAARWRLLAHFIGAALGLYGLGGFPSIFYTLFLGSSEPLLIDLGWVGHFIGLFYLVWLLNLYNFMDGIDGLASIEAISVSLGGAVLLFLSHQAITHEVLILVLLALTVLGFLFWNFPPAKIFMGDAGSGFLGIILGLLSIKAAWIAPQFFWSMLILLGAFIVDATWTLGRRFSQGEKVYEAHRSHAYQYAARYYGSHKKISLAVMLINVLWLLPWALAVGLTDLNVYVGLVLAYTPLVVLVIYFGAGKRELT